MINAKINISKCFVTTTTYGYTTNQTNSSSGGNGNLTKPNAFVDSVLFVLICLISVRMKTQVHSRDRLSG